MYLEMTVSGFTLDPIANRPVIILKDGRDNNTLPLWLSSHEALSIATMLLMGDGTARDGGKDLMTLLMAHTETEIGSIVIEEVQDGVFSSVVKFFRNGEELLVKVRLCEAIMTALKYKMPIMVAEEVLERTSVLAMNDEEIARESNARRFADFLENLDPAMLGKYPM